MDILHKIKTRTAKLDRSPEPGRIVPELLKQGISRYREIIIKSCRIIYGIEGDKVYVVSVIDRRRNMEDLLLSRLLR